MTNENQSPTPKMPPAVVFFTLAYLLPAIAAAVWTRNGEFFFYCVVMVVLAAFVIFVHRSCDLSQPVLWGLSVWGAAHMVGGLVPIPASWPNNGPNHVVYSWWLIPNYLKYDQVVHAFGFGVATFVCWHGFAAVVRSIDHPHRLQPTLGVLFLCIAASTGLGALNEVIEFTATLPAVKHECWRLRQHRLGSSQQPRRSRQCRLLDSLVGRNACRQQRQLSRTARTAEHGVAKPNVSKRKAVFRPKRRRRDPFCRRGIRVFLPCWKAGKSNRAQSQNRPSRAFQNSGAHNAPGEEPERPGR